MEDGGRPMLDAYVRFMGHFMVGWLIGTILFWLTYR